MMITLVLLRLVSALSIKSLGGKHWCWEYSLSIKFFNSDGSFIMKDLYICLYGKVFKKFYGGEYN
jgi:hypothetical protein